MAAPQLTLLSLTGAVVARSGLVQDGVASVDLTVFESGLYFLRVDNAGIEGNIGTYFIETKSVETNSNSDDISDNFTTTNSIAPGSSLNTAIDFEGDVDLVSFTVEANTSYVLDALGAGANSGSLANSHLIVYDASGVQIAKDKDSGKRRCPRNTDWWRKRSNLLCVGFGRRWRDRFLRVKTSQNVQRRVRPVSLRAMVSQLA